MEYVLIIVAIVLLIVSINYFFLTRYYKKKYLTQNLAYEKVTLNNTEMLLDYQRVSRKLEEIESNATQSGFYPISTNVTPEAQNAMFVADSPKNNIAIKTGTIYTKLDNGKIVSCYKTKRQGGKPKKIPVFVKVFR